MLESLHHSLSTNLHKYTLNIIDNTPQELEFTDIESLITKVFPSFQYNYSRNSSNRGFGAGHNLALDMIAEFHLLLNPDLILDEDALTNAMAFTAGQSRVWLIDPQSLADNGQRQFLCKRYLTVLDLLLRGFAPPAIRKLFHKRLAHYEMADVINEQDVG